MRRTLGALSVLLTHEIVEAATDPLPTAGWIDNSIDNRSPAYERLWRGEAADICTRTGRARNARRPSELPRCAYWSNQTGRGVMASP